MKTLALILALGSLATAAPEPLATGTATQIPNSGSFLLRFSVSKAAGPGLRFYPGIRFVLDDETWIDGKLGCFPFGAVAGDESGGEIHMGATVEIPAGRTLKHVAVVAAVGDPRDSPFGVQQGEAALLDDHKLEQLKIAGGFILSFPITSAEQAEAPKP